jgi:hypothetical protein
MAHLLLLPLALLGAALAPTGTRADLYLHHIRGSNNKLNEVQGNVRNDNRLFDSQNNANAGYNVGDDCTPSCAVDTNNDNNAAPDTYDPTLPGAGKGMMYYYAGSLLHLEWTAQHGCGRENTNLDCQIIIQYACEDTMPGLRNGKRIATIGGGQNDNGQNTGDQNPWTNKDERQSPNPDKAACAKEGDLGCDYGEHEPYDFWMKCKMRERNKGLFTADRLTSTQNQQTAIYTRQGDNAERYGFECPEERDYYPYWHPTPWRDAIIMTDSSSHCSMYQKESQNVADKGECIVENYECKDHKTCVDRTYNRPANQNDAEYSHPPLPNNRAACEKWSERYGTDMPAKWAENGRYDTWAPKCVRTPYQRTNHHGNTVGGYPAVRLMLLMLLLPVWVSSVDIVAIAMFVSCCSWLTRSFSICFLPFPLLSFHKHTHCSLRARNGSCQDGPGMKRS